MSKLETVFLTKVLLIGDNETTYKGYPAEHMQAIKDLMLDLINESVQGAYSGSHALERLDQKVREL